MAPNLSFTGVLDGYGMKSLFPRFLSEDATAMRRDEGVFSSSDKNGRSEVRALHVVRLFGDNLRCQALLELYHLQQT